MTVLMEFMSGKSVGLVMPASQSAFFDAAMPRPSLRFDPPNGESHRSVPSGANAARNARENDDGGGGRKGFLTGKFVCPQRHVPSPPYAD